MQFNRFSHPVAFPSDDQIEEYSKLVQQNNPFNQVSDSQAQLNQTTVPTCNSCTKWNSTALVTRLLSPLTIR